MFLECTDFLALVGVYCEGVKGALTLLTGLQNGVTHLLISPDGNTLHAGYRKVYLPNKAVGSVLDCICSVQFDKIQSWDLRNPGKMLYELKREVCTNQRIYFDVYG